MLISEETYKIQSALARYCRTDDKQDLPGIAENRIHQYRRLVYNIIDDTFEGAFPITRSFLSDEEWHRLINDFFANHNCQTPSVWKLPFEFYEHVLNTALEIKTTYPFLTDLLYFEWLEIEVHTMPDIDNGKVTQNGSWLKDTIAINREFKLVRFNYPVHQCKPSELNTNLYNGDYFVLIYREQDSGDVQFFNLSALYAFIISQLEIPTKNLDEIISEVCTLFRIDRNSEVDATIISFLKQMKEKKFVLGFSA